MAGSSLMGSRRKGSRTLSGEARVGQEPGRSRGHSSESGLAWRLNREFDAPVGILDPRLSAWTARLGLPCSLYPSPDAVLTAAFASGVLQHGVVFVWRPERDGGPWWLCLPIPRPGGDIVALIGFADREQDRIVPESALDPDDDPSEEAESRGWGPPCPERALRAWGQVVADDLRGEAFPRTAEAPPRPEGAERLMVARLIRRMKISDAPGQFQDLSLKTIRTALGLTAAAWIPSNPKEPIVLAGEIQGFDQHDYRSLIPESMDGPVFLKNDPHPDDLPGLNRYAVVAAETSDTSGWIVALEALDDRPFGSGEVEMLQPIASLIGNQRMNWRLYREIKDMLFGIIRALTAAIDAKDTYTKGHSERVARISVKIAEALNLPSHQRGDIYLMGLLHDIGKIGIHDDVLNKKGPLTPDEYRAIQEHVEIGVKILNDLKKLHHVIPAVRHHHESWDGTGYPCKLAGEAIPYEARILAVADSFDAMSSSRPYRQRLSPLKIDQILKDGAGKQWDPDIIEALFACRADVEAIANNKEGATGNTLVVAVDGVINGKG